MNRRPKRTLLDDAHDELVKLHDTATATAKAAPDFRTANEILQEALVLAIGTVATLRDKESPEVVEQRQAAWYEAAVRFCDGKRPPFVPYSGRSKHVVESGWDELASYFLNHGPKWTTGIGAIEAIDHIVNEAESNGNLAAWNPARVLAHMKLGRMKIKGDANTNFYNGAFGG